MKFFAFLGLTMVFRSNFFAYVDGQLPMPLPGLFPPIGLAPLPLPFHRTFPAPGLPPSVKGFRIRWPTMRFADRSFPNSGGTRFEPSKTAAGDATNTIAEKITAAEPTNEFDISHLSDESFLKSSSYFDTSENGHPQ